MTSLAITKELSSLLVQHFVYLDLYVSLYEKYQSGNFAEWNRIEENNNPWTLVNNFVNILYTLVLMNNFIIMFLKTLLCLFLFCQDCILKYAKIHFLALEIIHWWNNIMAFVW